MTFRIDYATLKNIEKVKAVTKRVHVNRTLQRTFRVFGLTEHHTAERNEERHVEYGFRAAHRTGGVTGIKIMSITQ